MQSHMHLDSTHTGSEGHSNGRSWEDIREAVIVNISFCPCCYCCSPDLASTCLVPTAKIPNTKWDAQFSLSTYTTLREHESHFVCPRKEGKSNIRRTVLFHT